jgi:hypothetical protein
LDVEGGELEVLKGVNYEEYRFNVICVESRDIEMISEYLTERGYLLIRKLSQHDYLFLHNEYAAAGGFLSKGSLRGRLRVFWDKVFATRGVL